MSSPRWMSLMRHVCYFSATTLLAVGAASAQSASSPFESSSVLSAESSSSVFPFAADGPCVCHQCRVQRQHWISENPDLCRVLRSPTTYEAYCDRQLAGIIDRTARDRLKQEAAHRIKERATEIASQMEPGDELWEWDGGGWHHFAGRGGVAIVRDGKIVKKWCEARS